MKLRNLLFAFGLTFTAIGFSACSDESEEIVPRPLDSDEAVATVGNETEDHDPMD